MSRIRTSRLTSDKRGMSPGPGGPQVSVESTVRFRTGSIGFLYKDGVVTSVSSSSQAGREGVRKGWVIVSVNGNKIGDDKVYVYICICICMPEYIYPP